MESGTRRRLSAIFVAGILTLAAVRLGRASVGPIEQTGVFALQGGTPKIVSKFWAEHGPGLTATLKVRQFQMDSKTPILNYDVDMERTMHMVVVRDDFATFAHLHPALDVTTGTFSQSFTKEPNHRYYVYADTTPHGIGQQVFRFTIESDGPVSANRTSFAPSSPVAQAGPYTVTLRQTTLTANAPQTLDVAILRDGKPAQGLRTYLGAAAHVVLVNTSTLAYVHIHPMVRGSATMDDGMMSMPAQAGPLLQMTTPALPAGTYKMWMQFRAADKRLYVAAFTMLAR